MPRDRASKIQILSAKHKGLLLVVDKMFDKYATLQQVREMIEQKYHEKISETAVNTYKTRHWKVQKDRILEQKTAMKAIAELVGEDGLSAGVTALLWEALQTMTPPQLIALKRALDNHEKTELAKKLFALRAEEKAGVVTVVNAADDYAEAQKVVQQVKEIFGIGMTGIEPPEPRLLGPAQQSPSAGAPVSARSGNE